MSLINEALQRARDEALRQEAVKKGVPLAPVPKRRKKSHLLAITVIFLSIALAITAIAILGLAKRSPTGTIELRKGVAEIETVPTREVPDSASANLPTQAEPTKSPAPTLSPPPAIEQPPSADSSTANVTSQLPESVATPAARTSFQKSRLPTATEPLPNQVPTPSSAEENVFIRHVDLGEGVSIDLGGIAWSENGPYALLNGRVVGVGESVSGFIVREIDPLRVVVEHQDRQIVLKLK